MASAPGRGTCPSTEGERELEQGKDTEERSGNDSCNYQDGAKLLGRPAIGILEEMIRANRSTEAAEVITSKHGPVRLIWETWSVSIGSGRWRWGFVYHRPRRVAWRHHQVGVVDHLAVARLLMVAILLLAMIIGKRPV
jgi:hypothetical protein